MIQEITIIILEWKSIMSNLIVKMMSDEQHLDDANKSKGFRLVESFGEVLCWRDKENKPVISIPTIDGQTSLFHPEGNTYLLHNGKTVSIFNYEPLVNVKVTHGKATLASVEEDSKELILELTSKQDTYLNLAAGRTHFIAHNFNEFGDDKFKVLSKPCIHAEWCGATYIADNNSYVKVGRLLGATSSKGLQVLNGYSIEYKNKEYLLTFNPNIEKGKGGLDILAKVTNTIDLILGKHQEECLIETKRRGVLSILHMNQAGYYDEKEKNQYITFKDVAPINIQKGVEYGFICGNDYYFSVGKLATNTTLPVEVLELLNGWTILHYYNNKMEEFVLIFNHGNGSIELLKKEIK